MVKVGDRKTETLHFGEGNSRTYTGRVVYVHPERRFYIVEFGFEKGSFRETFYPEERRAHNMRRSRWDIGDPSECKDPDS